MPVISMPDGSVVEFPDSMSSAEINQQLAGWKPSGDSGPVVQNNSWSRLPEMAGSALVKGAVNLAGLPGDVGDLATRGLNLLTGGPSPDQVRAAVDKSLGFHVPGLPTSNDLTAPLQHAGVVNNPSLTPTTPLERYGSAALEAVPSIAATVASGGMTALPAIATGEASAMASQGAHDLAPDSSWAPVVAGLVTGLGVGGAAGKVENALTASATNKQLTAAAARLEAARQAAAAASDAKFQGAKNLVDTVADVKSASQSDFDSTKNQLAADLAANHAQQDQVVESVASGLGKSQTLQDAGTVLQTHARNWLTNTLPDKLDAVWQPVNNAIPKTMTLPLSQFSSALEGINKSAGGLEPVAALLKPSLPAKLAAKLNGKEEAEGDLEDLVPGATGGTPGQYTWEDVSKLRSALGEAMSNPKTVMDIGAKNMSRLYASLTTDMRVAADRAGAVPEFDAANAESQRLYQIAEGPMGRVVASARASADDPAPEAVAKSLLASAKSGATDLGVLRNEIPQGVNELAAATIRLDPKGFARLPPESLGALVPDGSASATVLGAQAAKESALAAQKQGLALAQQNKAANIAAIQKAQTEGNWNHAVNLRNSSKEVSDAKAALANAQAKVAALPKNSVLDHSGSSILGAILGDPAGQYLATSLHHTGGLGQVLGGMAGAAAPMIVRGGVNLLKPKSVADLAYPGLGGVVGANALSPPPQ